MRLRIRRRRIGLLALILILAPYLTMVLITTISQVLQQSLITAVKQGDNNKVAYLLRLGVNANTVELPGRPGTFWQTLVYAIWHPRSRSQSEGVPVLLLVGDNNEKLGSHEAAIVRDLLAHGANPNIKDEVGNSPMATSYYHYGTGILADYLNHGADANVEWCPDTYPLIAVVNEGDIAAVKLLLDHGANINIAEPEDSPYAGETPIMEAVLRSNITMVRLLVERGADIRRKTPDGSTALSLAIQYEEGPDRNAMIDCLKKAAAKR